MEEKRDMKYDNINNSGHPEGSILLLTLVILLLMGLMGTALIVNSTTEKQITYNTNVGRDAFLQADSLSRIGTLVGRSLLYEGAGDISQLVKSRPVPSPPAADPARPPFNLEIDPGFNFDAAQTLGEESTKAAMRERYLMATAAATPHLTLKYGDNVVATAAIAIEQTQLAHTGASVLEDTYDTNDGTTIRVHILVSASGRVPLLNYTGGTYRTDSDSLYHDGVMNSAHSIVTSVFLEVLQ